MATIITKNSSTASSVPAAGSLQQGELAVNVTDKKLYTKDSSAAVVKLVGSLGNQEANAVAITGGTINGTAIGGTTPAAAAFTTASASGGFTGNLTGNASTVTNGVYITGSYADPAWITSLAGSKITGNISGNAANVTGTVAIANGGTGLTALGTGVQTALGQTVTGSGGIVLAASPSLTTPNLGTPSAVTLTNATGLPVSTGISGLGTNVATALGVSVGSVGSVVVNGGALGTPSSGTLTNATGLPLSTGVTGTLAVANGGTGITAFGSGVATALGVNVGSAGAFVVNGGALGTPSSGTVTNLTGTASININGTVGATTPTTGAFTTLSASGNITVSGGTANGVAYLNGSKVLTTGSALSFNGTRFTTYVTSDTNTNIARFGVVNTAGTDDAFLDVSADAANNLITLDSTGNNVGAFAFRTGGGEQMRLTSTGLGIGTSSPAYKLDLTGSNDGYGRQWISTVGYPSSADNSAGFQIRNLGAGVGGIRFANFANSVEWMRITSAGDVGIGTSSPTAVTGSRRTQVIRGTSSELLLQSSNATDGTSVGITYTAAGNDAYFVNRLDGFFAWLTGSAGNTERMRLDSSGNLGLGVTPSAWRSGARAFQSGGNKYVSLWEQASGAVNLSFACYESASNTFAYTTTGDSPTLYSQLTGAHRWYTAPSGTAGNTISFTQAMTLNSSGNLGIGTTSPGYRLDVSGYGRFSSGVVGSGGLTMYGDTSSASGAFLSTAGNLGLGVTPSAWNSIYKAMQFGPTGAIYSSTNNDSFFSNNVFWNASNSPRYIVNAAATYYYQNAGAHAWAVAASGTAGNAISFTQAMTLTASGQLLVGTTTYPTDDNTALGFGVSSTGEMRAAVNNASAAMFKRASSDGDIVVFRRDSAVVGTIGSASGGIYFASGGTTERARITSGGYFKASNNGTYVGSTSSYHELINSANGRGTIISCTNATLSTDGIVFVNADRNTTDNSFYAISYYNTGAAAFKFRVADSGNVTNTNNSYGAISDIKLKENITDATPKLSSLNQLRVVNYNFKGSDLKQIGLVAQEVEQVFPGLVETAPDRDAEGNDLGTTTKSVKYSVLVPMLLKAVQELTAMNDDLRARVAQLEAK